MQIVHVEVLCCLGKFNDSADWQRIRKDLHDATRKVVWPPKSDKFTINPVKKGNGVVPIKDGLMFHLREEGWKLEEPMDLVPPLRPGKLDAVLETGFGPFAVEWETGNISSSHRAINKLCLGLLKKKLVGGMLIVPSRKLYQYLTDRIGNWNELAPYIDLWNSIPIEQGALEIVVIEQDGESEDVPRIKKGTDGRALR